MRSALCYLGTNIPLIRGGAPDTPAAGPRADGGAAAPAAGAKPDGGTSAASPKASDAAGERDYKKEYGELEARYKQYERFGKPEDIETSFRDRDQKTAQLNAIAKEFQEGRITYKQAQQEAAKVETGEPADPFEGIEDLEPRAQVKRITDVLRKELGGTTQAETAAIRDEMKKFQGNIGQQLKLAWKLSRLAATNPDLDVDSLIAQATEAAAFGPEQFVDLAFERANHPAEVKKAVATAVAAKEAEIRAEYENKRVPLTTRPTPRLFSEKKAGGRDTIHQNFMERLRAANDKAAGAA